MTQLQTALVPGCLSKYRELGRGSTGLVFKIDDDIAIKITSRVVNKKNQKDQAEALARENLVFDIFEAQEPCPYIIQSIIRCGEINFMQFMPGGTVDALIEANQLRTPQGRLVSVTRTIPMEQAEQWAMELAGGVAWLEQMGLSHCDLRPVNLMLDKEGHVKLIDFEEVYPIGSICCGHRAPWARRQGREAGPERGTWGLNGARTVQFSFGSVMYNVMYGMEPYEKDFQTEVSDWLQRMKFPKLGNSSLDAIISRCWRGQYASLKDLAEETATLKGAGTALRATTMSREQVSRLKSRCHGLLNRELADLNN